MSDPGVLATGSENGRRRRGWDIALSVFLLLLSAIAGFFGLILAIFTLALLDCPPETCSVDAAVGAQFVAGIAVLLTIAAGVIATVVMTARRYRTWWVALLTLAGVIGFWIMGLFLYGAAVS